MDSKSLFIPPTLFPSRLTVSRYYEHYELISHLYNQHQDLGHRHSEVNLSAYPDAENHYITDLFMLSAHRKDNFFVGFVLKLAWFLV